MIQTKRICLFPNNIARTKFLKSSGISRYAYNWAKKFSDTYYKLYGKSISINDLKKSFTKYRRQRIEWLQEVSNDVPKQAIKDYGLSRSNFFKTKKGFPKFKSKKRSKLSFYCDTEKTEIKNHYAKISKIGWVKCNYYGKDLDKILNPRVSFDGKYWYLTIGMECESQTPQTDMIENVIGIDLGLKHFAVTSDGLIFENINKSLKVHKTKKRLNRLQRKASRKYEINKDTSGRFVKTKNIIKLEKRIRLIYRKLRYIRENNINQNIADLLKMGNHFIMEDLNIKGMMKNRHLSRAIGEMGWYTFRMKFEQKCRWYGYGFDLVSRNYPSSKTCSKCGNIKKDLQLKDRVYVCENCEFEIDRDLNAAINLKQSIH